MKLGNVLQDNVNKSYVQENKNSSYDFKEIIERKDKNQETEEVKTGTSQASLYDYQAMLSEHITYLREKLQHGDIEEKFQIGNEAMTIGEWNRLLDNFDTLQEEILKGMRERHEIQNEKQEREEALRKLFEEREWLEEVRTKPHNVERKEKENAYFSLADKSGKIVYNEVTFFCDKKTNTLTLGDCRLPENCLRIPLEEGGSLLVNRNNLEDLLKAITMFSPEDQRRILEAIQKERMVESTMNELAIQKNDILKIGKPEEKEKLTGQESEEQEEEKEKRKLGI
ncbi:MAG: hypothetical protein IKL51_00195 [Lachnospiraceae bacterium]|nr:hypothetical protein [Lachnospiraceae bacterium]